MRIHVYGASPDQRSQHLWDLLRTSRQGDLPVSASYAHDRRGVRVTFEIGAGPVRRNEPVTLRLLQDAGPEMGPRVTEPALPSAAA